jgi:malate dehydrogenase (oxaloacetate-decarboxylating)(NADP+)
MSRIKATPEEILKFHKDPIPGKLAIKLTKPISSTRDLSIAYSPGVGVPCLEINKNPDLAYDYTSKGNFVAVISNGTAVLGLGNLGAMASKPVMEGKSALFKKFADIDSVDIEIDSTDAEEIINTVAKIGETWGGINLEDIKSPECFVIERKLKEKLNIPVFHDDQHGTAIVTLAGLINSCKIIGKKFEDLKIVLNGPGAAGIACTELIKNYGLKEGNIILCDTAGVLYKGRKESMNEWKEKHTVDTKLRTLSEALVGADVCIGLSVKGAFSKEMIKSMAPNPIIFAMANPDPEITPEEIREVRSDAIIATGRSDYPNQVNNVMCFPFLFRGALDVRSKQITEGMKVAASLAIAKLAEENVPIEIRSSHPEKDFSFGKNYIIPSIFDPRLLTRVSIAVAQVAVKEGVARKIITDWKEYERSLKNRIDPMNYTISSLTENINQNPKHLVIADGDDVRAISIANMWIDNECGDVTLVGRDEVIHKNAQENNLTINSKIKIINAASDLVKTAKYAEHLYLKRQRNGLLKSDCERLVKTDRNIFASMLIDSGYGDILLGGLTRDYKTTFQNFYDVLGNESLNISSVSLLISPDNKIIFIGNNSCGNCEKQNLKDDCSRVSDIVEFAKKFSIKPSVAFISNSNFGSESNHHSNYIQNLISKLKEDNNIDFIYDGEMKVSTALQSVVAIKYPFSKVAGNANVLIMPNREIANIGVDLIKSVCNIKIIGPILLGFHHSIHIANNSDDVIDIYNMLLVRAMS